MENNITTIIFSRNRSLQLDACLNGFFKYVKNDNSLNINIIYKSDESHKESYFQLKKDWSKKNINWIEETIFKNNILECLRDSEFVFLLCDDSLFTKEINIEEIINYLDNPKDPYSSGAIAFSLRLGLNTKYSYPLNKSQNVPDYIEMNDSDIILWDWSQGESDFGYALEVSSSIVPTKIILPIIQGYNFNNPNDLEWGLFTNLSRVANFFPYIFSYKNSRCFCNPINKTQTVNDNRSGNNPDYSSEKLRDLFMQGYRINIDKFDGFVSEAAHQEVLYDYVKVE